MFKVTTNSKLVSLQINKSLNAKKKAIDRAIDNTLKHIYSDAKMNASNVKNPEVDNLSDAIEIDLKRKVVGVSAAKAPYAPFIEFGTKTGFTSSPPKRELAGIASRYKGKRPDYKDLNRRLRKNGIKNPYLYAQKLTKVETRPEPFFYNSVFQNKRRLMNEFRRALRKRT